jgi:eukaryotic-like serine/threonine-protein kinase
VWESQGNIDLSDRMTGQTIGHYRILEQLGAGGMGIVYKALDTHLDRFVAIKVLPPEKVANAERKRRFVQEAKAASALNHPNIITIHDIASENGVDFIAMEYMPGRTLDELISRKGLRLNEALKYAIQIADALAKAHAAGIIHRDLKPGNIMVDDHGLVKLLDFGLAKLTEAMSPAEADPTRTLRPATEVGTILGTFAYAAPEQVEGKPVDTRSDIFSFGAVLYEMITGRRAFAAETTTATLVSVLHDQPPPIADIVQGVPRDLVRIIARCLRKDAARRYQVIDDAKLALEEVEEEPDQASDLPQPASPRLRSWAAAALGVMIGILLSLAGGFFLKNRPVPTTGPILTRLTSDSGLTTDPALSPDGKLLAYASDRLGNGGLDLWVRQISGGAPVQITHDNLNNREPSFSPDGSMIVFSSERAKGGIFVVPVLGGEPRQIAGQGRRPRFSPDGEQVVYWSGNDIEVGPRDSQRILVVPAGGGSPRLLSSGFLSARSPVWSPDGKRVLFLGTQGGNPPAYEEYFDWWVVSATGGLPVPLKLNQALARQRMSYPDPGVWTPDQKVVFTATLGDVRNVWRMPISSDGNRLTGSPERLTVGGGAETSLSWVGSRLVFAAENSAIDLWSLPADTNRGLVRGEMKRLTRDAGANFYPMASSDGSRMVFRSDRRGAIELWFKDFRTRREIPVFGSVDGHIPFLSPDGATAMYTNYEAKNISTYLIGISSDGSLGVPRKVCTDCNNPWTCSSNARMLLFSTDNSQQIYALDIETGQKRKVLESATSLIARPRFSPDDKWIAFVLRRGSAFRIYIAPHDGTLKREDQWVAITDESFVDHLPHWSPDGRLLYFYSDRDGNICLWAQRLDPGSKYPVGQPIAVQHFHTARQALKNVPLIMRGMSLTHDQIILNAGEGTGNIWMAEYGMR